MGNTTPNPPHDKEMPFLSHLIELRERLLKSILSVLLLFLALFYFANDFYSFIAQPLLNYLPEGRGMVAIDVATPFLTPLKLVFILSIFLAMPYLLYQVWAFVAPALYRHEKRLMLPLMASTVALFYLGAAFAYFFVFPMVFGFFAGVLPQGVEMATDISRYLDFVLKMFFAFGLAFETPVFIVLLVWAGIMTPQSLAEKRSYVIVIIFIVAMILTPPDVFSQTLLAIPMILLFEAGLFASRWIVSHKAAREAAQDEEYRPLTEAEMDAELARMDEEEQASKQASQDKQ